MSEKLENQIETEENSVNPETEEVESEEISTDADTDTDVDDSTSDGNIDSEENQEVSLIDRLRNNELTQLKSELETVVAKKIANRIADYKEKVKAELQK